MAFVACCVSGVVSRLMWCSFARPGPWNVRQCVAMSGSGLQSCGLHSVLQGQNASAGAGWGKFEEKKSRSPKSRSGTMQTTSPRKCYQSEKCSTMFQTRQQKGQKNKRAGDCARRDLTLFRADSKKWLGQLAGRAQLVWFPQPPAKPAVPSRLLMRPTSRIFSRAIPRQPVNSGEIAHFD